MIEVRLDGRQISDKKQLHDQLSMELGFPAWYGSNLDALYDCLTDISEPVAVACHMPEEEKDSYMEAYLDKLYGTFRDAEADNGNLAVFFGHLLY